MDWTIVVDLIGALAGPIIVLLGVWVKQLTATIAGLSSKIDRLEEDNHREHAEVTAASNELKENLTTEVRDINRAHSLHDQSMAVQGRVLEEILSHVRK